MLFGYIQLGSWLMNWARGVTLTAKTTSTLDNPNFLAAFRDLDPDCSRASRHYQGG
jgi:hypothetical protein